MIKGGYFKSYAKSILRFIFQEHTNINLGNKHLAFTRMYYTYTTARVLLRFVKAVW